MVCRARTTGYIISAICVWKTEFLLEVIRLISVRVYKQANFTFSTHEIREEECVC